MSLRFSLGRRRLAMPLGVALAFVLAFPEEAAAAKHHAPGAETTPSHHVINSLLEADEVTYDKDTDIITASGHVEIQREGNVLLADKVVYNRTTDIATATGHVSVIEPSGMAIFVDHIEVTGSLKQALASKIRTLLADKSRMTAAAFRRVPGDIDEFYKTAYTACDVCEGKSPVWKVQADHVERDVDKQMVYYHDVSVDLLGVPIFYTPYLSSPDPTAGRKSGFLMPEISVSGANLGVAYAQPYYFNLAPDRDLTLTPIFSTAGGKGATFEYREDFEAARLDVTGSGVADDPATPGIYRGNLQAVGTWDMTDTWRSGMKVDLASDQTYLLRYAAVLVGQHRTALPWLESNAYAENFGTNSYFSIHGYYFENQLDIINQQSPIVVPELAYNYTSDALPWGGFLQFDASGVALSSIGGGIEGSDRLSAMVSYIYPYTSPQGFVLTGRASFRADGYRISDYLVPTSGQDFNGTIGRTVPDLSLEWRWPLERPSTNFTQVIEPIAAVLVSPLPHNPLVIPNEDASDFELDDTNIFDPQRLPGYDRVEGGARVAYGLRWSAYDKGGSITAELAQSYSFHRDPQFLPLSGLYYNASDYVGHINFSPNQYISLQYRFRYDKDTWANRRTEVTGVFGPDILRFTVSYINIPAYNPALFLEPFQHELYTAVNARVTRYWSISLDNRQDLAPGGGTIVSDLGLHYEDECFFFNFAMSRNNTSNRDFQKSLGVYLTLGFKTIGIVRGNTDVGGGVPH